MYVENVLRTLSYGNIHLITKLNDKILINFRALNIEVDINILGRNETKITKFFQTINIYALYDHVTDTKL